VRARQVIIRIIICVVVLLFGLLAMNKLSALKRPPVETKQSEQRLQVEGLTIEQENIRVTLTGYGEIKTLNTVSISPEISGRIVYVHPRLETGGIIPRGETLFKIDSRIYAATIQEAKASLEQLKNTVLRLEKQYEIDQNRQTTIERNRELAGLEFKRLQQLYEVNNVGTRSGVDKAEQAYNAAIDQADQMARALALYPLQIQEVSNSIEAAEARMSIARLNMERCRVTSPFDGRIKSVSVEIGQIVSPGQAIISLADDAHLEIQISLDAKDARQWLQFKNPDRGKPNNWFSKPVPVACYIYWTENPKAKPWKGIMDRVLQFNPQTRTLTVAVRVEAGSLPGGDGTFPLVEGMFCRVDIPGKPLRNVVRLPRWSVSFENTVYLSNAESRLTTVPVTVLRTQGEDVFVSEGLAPGQIVVTTRLTDPLENALLAVTLE